MNLETINLINYRILKSFNRKDVFLYIYRLYIEIPLYRLKFFRNFNGKDVFIYIYLVYLYIWFIHRNTSLPLKFLGILKFKSYFNFK